MYTLISVDRTAAPEGIDASHCCRYIIARHGSTIVVYRRGTVAQVTRHAADYVDELNARAMGQNNPYCYPPDATGRPARVDPARSRSTWTKANYTLVSVDPTTVPETIDGRNWSRYIIARDPNTIVGYRLGTPEQVTEYAKHHVETLNARASGRIKAYGSCRAQQNTSPTEMK